jgi:hypothetical protein
MLKLTERNECPKCGRRAQGETFTGTKPGEAQRARLEIRRRNPKGTLWFAFRGFPGALEAAFGPSF